MSLWDRLTGEFIDVIEWTADDGRAMVWKFETAGNSIQYGAKLTVREGQAAVFFNEGRIADVFGPGMYMLKTNTLPILSALQHWDHGFQSPFKSEVYFVSLKRFGDLKWGTKNPIMMRDPEFGPVRLRAFGSYAIRVADPARFMTEVVGGEARFEVGEIAEQLRQLIVARFADALASARIPALDLATQYDDIGEFLRRRMEPEIRDYGLELVQLVIENVSFPPEVEQALDKRTGMGVIGDLDRYKHYEAGRALGQSGAGSAAGVVLGGMLGQSAGGILNAPAPEAKPVTLPPQPAPYGLPPADEAAPAAAARKDESPLRAPGASAPYGGQAHAPASPPPLPPGGRARLWHVALDGAPAGPYDEASVRVALGNGRLPGDALVWTEGMAAWAPAREALGLDEAKPARAVPPPLPRRE